MVNSILLVSMLIFSVLFLETSDLPSLFWKTLASTIFVTLAFINFDINKKNLKHSLWLLIGIFYSFVADVLLEIEFIIGAVFFAISHICFIISFSKIKKLNLKDLKISSIFAILTIISILFINYYINPIESLMFMVMIIYAIIISLMTGKSIANYISLKTETNKILLIGAVLFFISDVCLMLNLFAGFRIFRYPNVILYYTSLYYLAISMNKKLNL